MLRTFACSTPRFRELYTVFSQYELRVCASLAMPELFPRRVKPLVVEGLDHARIVLVAGARQVGKTTLVIAMCSSTPARTLRGSV